MCVCVGGGGGQTRAFVFVCAYVWRASTWLCICVCGCVYVETYIGVFERVCARVPGGSGVGEDRGGCGCFPADTDQLCTVQARNRSLICTLQGTLSTRLSAGSCDKVSSSPRRTYACFLATEATMNSL